jgi:hypothetical protein
MTSVAESIPALSGLAATLQAGVDQISDKQSVTFLRYTRVVLPLEGWLFWVNSNLLDPPTLYPPVIHEGSLHYATKQNQSEDETIGINRVVFTAMNEIEDFNEISPTVSYISQDFDGIRFAFNSRKSFYKQAQLWHYEGDAVYPVMNEMIIDDLSQFDQTDIIVSDSLPIWLAMFTPKAWPQPTIPTFPIYPSFAVPENLRPPYATVHINPDTTSALAAMPSFDNTDSQAQLAFDRVRVTLYGVRNDKALDFQRFVYQYMIDTDDMGLMDQQVMRDQKRTQSELNVLAIKKVIEFQVSYLQTRARDVALQYILHCTPSFLPLEGPTGFINNGGVLCLSPNSGYPTSPSGLTPGKVWSNGSVVMIVSGHTPSVPPLHLLYGHVTASQLLTVGGGNLPLTQPPVGSNLLWNNGDVCCVA